MQLLCKKFKNLQDAEDYCNFLNSLNEDINGDCIQNIGIDYIPNFMDTGNTIVIISIVESPIMDNKINYDAIALRFFYDKEVNVESEIKEYNKCYGKNFTPDYIKELQKRSGEVFKHNIAF